MRSEGVFGQKMGGETEIPSACGRRYLDRLLNRYRTNFSQPAVLTDLMSVFGFRPLRKQAFDGSESKNSQLLAQPAVNLVRGETEIRTRDTLLEYTRFPGVNLSPYCDLIEKL